MAAIEAEETFRDSEEAMNDEAEAMAEEVEEAVEDSGAKEEATRNPEVARCTAADEASGARGVDTPAKSATGEASGVAVERILSPNPSPSPRRRARPPKNPCSPDGRYVLFDQ